MGRLPLGTGPCSPQTFSTSEQLKSRHSDSIVSILRPRFTVKLKMGILLGSVHTSGTLEEFVFKKHEIRKDANRTSEIPLVFSTPAGLSGTLWDCSSLPLLHSHSEESLHRAKSAAAQGENVGAQGVCDHSSQVRNAVLKVPGFQIILRN